MGIRLDVGEIATLILLHREAGTEKFKYNVTDKEYYKNELEIIRNNEFVKSVEDLVVSIGVNQVIKVIRVHDIKEERAMIFAYLNNDGGMRGFYGITTKDSALEKLIVRKEASVLDRVLTGTEIDSKDTAEIVKFMGKYDEPIMNLRNRYAVGEYNAADSIYSADDGDNVFRRAIAYNQIKGLVNTTVGTVSINDLDESHVVLLSETTYGTVIDTGKEPVDYLFNDFYSGITDRDSLSLTVFDDEVFLPGINKRPEYLLDIIERCRVALFTGRFKDKDISIFKKYDTYDTIKAIIRILPSKGVTNPEARRNLISLFRLLIARMNDGIKLYGDSELFRDHLIKVRGFAIAAIERFDETLSDDLVDIFDYTLLEDSRFDKANLNDSIARRQYARMMRALENNESNKYDTELVESISKLYEKGAKVTTLVSTELDFIFEAYTGKIDKSVISATNKLIVMEEPVMEGITSVINDFRRGMRKLAIGMDAKFKRTLMNNSDTLNALYKRIEKERDEKARRRMIDGELFPLFDTIILSLKSVVIGAGTMLFLGPILGQIAMIVSLVAYEEKRDEDYRKVFRLLAKEEELIDKKMEEAREAGEEKAVLALGRAKMKVQKIRATMESDINLAGIKHIGNIEGKKQITPASKLAREIAREDITEAYSELEYLLGDEEIVEGVAGDILYDIKKTLGKAKDGITEKTKKMLLNNASGLKDTLAEIRNEKDENIREDAINNKLFPKIDKYLNNSKSVLWGIGGGILLGPVFGVIAAIVASIMYESKRKKTYERALQVFKDEEAIIDKKIELATMKNDDKAIIALMRSKQKIRKIRKRAETDMHNEGIINKHSSSGSDN